MNPFNLQEYLKDPSRPLVLEHYNENVTLVWPIEQAQIVLGDRVAIQVPEMNYDIDSTVLIDKSGEVRDRGGHLIGYIRFGYPKISTADLAQRIHDLQFGEKLYFKRYVDRDLYGVTRLDLFESDNIFVSYFGGGNSSVFDACIECSVSGIRSWIEDVIDANKDTTLYLLSEEDLKMSPEEFAKRFGLTENLECTDEGWLISDTGNGLEVQANDDMLDICPDDWIAVERAKKRGIRFNEQNPKCPSDLRYNNQFLKPSKNVKELWGIVYSIKTENGWYRTQSFQSVWPSRQEADEHMFSDILADAALNSIKEYNDRIKDPKVVLINCWEE